MNETDTSTGGGHVRHNPGTNVKKSNCTSIIFFLNPFDLTNGLMVPPPLLCKQSFVIFFPARTWQAGPSPDATQTSNNALPASPQMFSGRDLDTMDLGQLKMEKLKMQINVLTLQKEYFTQKLKALKKSS